MGLLLEARVSASATHGVVFARSDPSLPLSTGLVVRLKPETGDSSGYTTIIVHCLADRSRCQCDISWHVVEAIPQRPHTPWIGRVMGLVVNH